MQKEPVDAIVLSVHHHLVCGACQCQRFATMSDLKTHLSRVHHLSKGTRVYQCPQCGMRFDYEGALTKHVLATHDPRIKKAAPLERKQSWNFVNNTTLYRCRTCGMPYYYASSMQRHQKKMQH